MISLPSPVGRWKGGEGERYDMEAVERDSMLVWDDPANVDAADAFARIWRGVYPHALPDYRAPIRAKFLIMQASAMRLPPAPQQVYIRFLAERLH